MTEWFTGNFGEINWDALHIIYLYSDGIAEWKELYATEFDGDHDYQIKHMHAWKQYNSMQKSAHIIGKSHARSGEDAKLEVCEGLYHGLLSGYFEERYEGITKELFLKQPSLKKLFFEVVFA